MIDGMDIARKLYDDSLTPGELCLQLLSAGKKVLPDFIVPTYRMNLTGFGKNKKNIILGFLLMH